MYTLGGQLRVDDARSPSADYYPELERKAHTTSKPKGIAESTALDPIASHYKGLRSVSPQEGIISEGGCQEPTTANHYRLG